MNEKQALTAWRDVGDPRGERQVLYNLGRLHEATDNLDRALEFHEQALALVAAAQDPEGKANSLCGLARVRKARGELEPARVHVEAALELIESLRYQVATEELRTSFLATKRPCYELYVDLLMELDQRSPGHGWAAAAFEAGERARARGLLEMLRETGSEIRRGVDPALLEHERNLRRKLNARHWRRALLARRADAAELRAADREIATLLEEARTARSEIRSHSSAYSALTQPEPISVAELRSLLDPDELVLEYWLGDERSFGAIAQDCLVDPSSPGAGPR